MTIVEISKSCNGWYTVKDIWFTRIYSPTCTTTYNMWNGKCTFLINDRLCTVCYKSPDITPMMEMTKGVPIKFHSPLMLDSSTTQILRDNVIINICEYILENLWRDRLSTKLCLNFGTP